MNKKTNKKKSSIKRNASGDIEEQILQAQITNTQNLVNEIPITTDSTLCQTSNSRLAAWRARRKEKESVIERELRLNRERNAKSILRTQRNALESNSEKADRLEREATIKRSKHCDQNDNDTIETRLTRHDSQAKRKAMLRRLQSLEETEEEHNKRLYDDSFKKATNRLNRDLLETEQIRKDRLENEAINQQTRTLIKSLEQTKHERDEILNKRALNKQKCRHDRFLVEAHEMRLERLQKETALKSNQRSIKNELETNEERTERLQLNNQLQSIRRYKRRQNETEKNCDLSHNIKVQHSPENIWPKVATTEIKHQCLNDFKQAMSNNVLDQIVCAICACLQYRLESIEINIAKVPNQHLLYSIAELPSCVLRVNLDINSNSGNIDISEQFEQHIINSEDSSVIINGMLLCHKGINLKTGFARLCNKCHNYLLMNKMPSLSLNNLMWIGDIPEDLRGLTLSEEKLIALYRHSNCIVKLFSIKGDPSLAQTALKGNVITFPQNVSDIAKSLPLTTNTLPDIIKIVFVGQTLPKKDQARTILTVRREIIRKALIWLHKNNTLYKNIDINHLLIDTLPINDIPDCLWNTVSLVDHSQSDNIERSGYVNNNLDPDDMCSTDVISLNTSALIDTSGGGISSNDIRHHLTARINITNDIATSNDNIYLVPQGQYPANEYFNTSFLPGLYPTLFPYGMGGVENDTRPIRVSYAKHIRYLLSYFDHRFERNTSFIFVTFNILQRRTACAKARILISRPYFMSQSIEINQLTASEIKTALNQMESNSYTHISNSRLSILLKQLKTVSGSVMGSNQSRANYRVELHSQIFFSGLPNIFITINPCDLHHPLAMKFAGIDLDIDNVLVDQLPKSQERAAIVAKHPVAIARFFNKLIVTVLSTLIGYNINKHESNAGGGVLGEINAYYGTVEESGRGALHLHMLLWLVNNKDPYELRQLISDEIFRQNLINYLEDIIKEDVRCFENDVSESNASNIKKHNHNLASICSPIPSTTDPNFEEKKRIAIKTLACQNQIHDHSSTCYKYSKQPTAENQLSRFRYPKEMHNTTTNSKYSKQPTAEDQLCRLRYPKETHDKTTINVETGEIRMKRAHPMMNNFNEWLLLACRCNMDIKFIWSGADTKSLVYYITDYITKKNLSFHDCNSLIYQAVEKFEKNERNINYTDALDKSRRLILRCFNTLASQQEISSVQVASYLMGWPDHYTSHTFINIYLIGIERYLEQQLTKFKQKTNYKDKDATTIDNIPFSLFESYNENDEEDDNENESFELETCINEEELVLCNKRIDYELRPIELSNICLYTFYAEYRKAKAKTADKGLFEINVIETPLPKRGRPANDRWLFQTKHPQYSSHIIIRRCFSLVPVLIGPCIPRRERDDTSERYARAILTLFYPWRSISDIREVEGTWNDALKIRENMFTSTSNTVINNIQLLHDCKRDRDSDLFQLVNQPLPSQSIKKSSPYSDANLEDTEEILALLEESIYINPSLMNEEKVQSDGIRSQIKREYLKSTLANVIRTERFSYITNITGLPDFVFNNDKYHHHNNNSNNIILKSIENNQTNGLVHKANQNDFQQIRTWQYNLKLQKEQMRHQLLYGLQEETNNEKEIVHTSINILQSNDNHSQLSVIVDTIPCINVQTPNFIKIFNLNDEQSRIFNVVSSHIKRTIDYETNKDINRIKPDQLLMYIGGAGGCGKSRVIDAISAFMSHNKRLHTLRSLAPSSAAAVGINGLTIQSMLHEARYKSSATTTLTQTDMSTIENEWRNINYCLIDEISMVGCHMLARIHKITTIAKHTQPSIPFGGINMIFIGDFVQYPPVLDRPLYSNLLSSNDSLEHTLSLNNENTKQRNVTERDIQCKVGRALWLQVNKVFFLTQQMRNKDKTFMDMQSRLRIGECTDEDYKMLCKRVISSENDVKSLRESPWNSSTMLVFRNEVRTNINNYCVFDESIKCNHSPMVVVANDQVRNHEIDNNELRRFLLSIPDNKTEGLPGYLPIVINMPVLITHNIATELHISNGSIGRLVRLVLDDNECVSNNDDIVDVNFPKDTIYIRKPLYALVELPGSKLSSCLNNLQPTIIPIVPEEKKIKIDLKKFITPTQKRLLNNRTSITITRTQLPIVPAYAMTTYKCQGKTLPSGVIDLVTPPYSKSDIADIYVPVSRFTSLDTMAILRHFPRSLLNHKPHPDMVMELKRLENLYESN